MKQAATWFVSVVFIGFLAAYASIFKRYSNALANHQSLTELFTDPNVRIAHGAKGKEIIKKIQAVQDEKKQVTVNKQLEEQKRMLHLLQQLTIKAPALMAQQTTPLLQSSQVAPLTLKNLPPTQRKDSNNYNYSLCESVDYQRESFPQENSYSIEQVQALLNQQKAEFEKRLNAIAQQKAPATEAVHLLAPKTVAPTFQI